MALKTNVEAAEGRQEIQISREFELPLDLLFRAFEEADLLEQWMGTKVIKLECMNQGAYRFETTDPIGNKHVFSGVIHEFKRLQHIVRTFEMENTGFGVQLEFLEFEALGVDRSKLNMHIIFRSIAHRDQLLQLPFAKGINMAHNRIEEILKSTNDK